MTTKKTSAQLNREINEALASPPKPGGVRGLVEQMHATKRARRGDVLRAIRKAPVAVVMTDRNGRETLAIVTRGLCP